jgi:hypothetical protein
MAYTACILILGYLAYVLFDLISFKKQPKSDKEKQEPYITKSEDKNNV